MIYDINRAVTKKIPKMFDKKKAMAIKISAIIIPEPSPLLALRKKKMSAAISRIILIKR